MVRPIRIAAVALVVFLVAAGAGVLVASHWGPERTRALLETTLSERLGAPVTVRESRLYFGGGALSWMSGILLDAEGIETHPEDDDAPRLVIGQLQADLDPLALLTGRVRVRSLALDQVRATLGWSGLPDVSAPPPDAEGAAPAEEPIVGWLEAIAERADQALSGPLSEQDVTLDRSVVEWNGPPLSPDGPPLTFTLTDLGGALRARGAGAGQLALTGRIVEAGEDARLTLDLTRDRRGALQAELVMDRLALAWTASLLAGVIPQADIGGSGTFQLSAKRPQEGVFEVSARLDAADLSGSLPRMGDGRPVPIAFANARAGISLDVDPERVNVSRAFAAAEDTEITATAEIARPVGETAHTIGSIHLDHYDLSKRAHLIALLPPRQIAIVEGALEPLRSGRLEDLRISGQARLGEWTRAFDDETRGLLPETVEARTRFTGFAVRAGDAASITDLSGTAVWSGDRIQLQRVRGRRAGHWMPVLDATLDGVSQLAANAEAREVPDAHESPLMLGLGPMYDIVVDPNKPRGEMPGALLLDLDYVVHPTLVWPLRNLFVRANPGEDGIRLLLEHAVWGRVPIRAEGVWTMEPEGQRRVERVVVKISLKEAIQGLQPLDLSDPIWARGRWHLDAHNLGDWRVHKSTGAFHAQGQNVRLVTYDMDLGIAGRALGEGTIDFSDSEELPYWTTVRVVDGKAPGIVDKIGFEPHEATGDVALDGEFHGELRPGRRVMAGMEGTLQVTARDGSILRKLPVILAIAKATDTFNPFGKRDEMKFSEIDATLDIDRGQVHARELRINGSDLRLLATGTVDAVDPEHPVEAVVGIFFFKALDRVIGVVPVLSDLILGEDENLMGAYVELSGAWAHPNASLVPLKTLATGPASLAVEGVPRFVRRAISAIQSAFERPGPDVAAPPPTPRGEDS